MGLEQDQSGDLALRIETLAQRMYDSLKREGL